MKKRNLEKGELGFILALGVFSLICFIGSLLMFLKTPTLSSEGAVPLFTSTVLLLMVLFMLIEIRICPRGFAKGTALGQMLHELFAFLFPGKVGVIILYCIVYAVLLGFVGFVVSTLIFLVGSMLTLNREKPVQACLVSVITLACIMILFQYIFKVQLP